MVALLLVVVEASHLPEKPLRTRACTTMANRSVAMVLHKTLDMYGFTTFQAKCLGHAIRECTLMVADHNCLPLQLAQLQCSGGLSLSLGRFPLSVYVFLEERRVHACWVEVGDLSGLFEFSHFHSIANVWIWLFH